MCKITRTRIILEFQSRKKSQVRVRNFRVVPFRVTQRLLTQRLPADLPQTVSIANVLESDTAMSYVFQVLTSVCSCFQAMNVCIAVKAIVKMHPEAAIKVPRVKLHGSSSASSTMRCCTDSLHEGISLCNGRDNGEGWSAEAGRDEDDAQNCAGSHVPGTGMIWQRLKVDLLADE